MDSSDLEVFATVAREGSMTRGASALCTVQSNVTTRVRRLEEELGARLFNRHKSGISLTPAAERLLPYAEKVHRLLSEAKRALSPESEPMGPLRIGSLETTAAMRLSPLLTRYARAFPNVEFSLATGTPAHLVEEVLAYRLEGAFVTGPIDRPNLTSLAAFQERLALYSPLRAGDPMRLLKTGRAKALVFRVGCAYRQRLERFFLTHGAAPIRFLEFGSLDGIMSCVAAGLGVTMLPEVLRRERSWWSRWKDTVSAHDLPAADAIVPTVFVRRSDAFESTAMSRFLELIHPRGEK